MNDRGSVVCQTEVQAMLQNNSVTVVAKCVDLGDELAVLCAEKRPFRIQPSVISEPPPSRRSTGFPAASQYQVLPSVRCRPLSPIDQRARRALSKSSRTLWRLARPTSSGLRNVPWSRVLTHVGQDLRPGACFETRVPHDSDGIRHRRLEAGLVQDVPHRIELTWKVFLQHTPNCQSD